LPYGKNPREYTENVFVRGYNLNALRDKAMNLTNRLSGYDIEYLGLSMEDM